MAWDERYLLDNQQAEAGQRFDALSVLFNPSTFRHARAVGLGVGWRVWEVGAGSSSAPAWFAEQVGSEGHVLATDIDTSWLEDDDLGYEVRRHEVGLDPPPAGPFDLPGLSPATGTSVLETTSPSRASTHSLRPVNHPVANKIIRAAGGSGRKATSRCVSAEPVRDLTCRHPSARMLMQSLAPQQHTVAASRAALPGGCVAWPEVTLGDALWVRLG